MAKLNPFAAKSLPVRQNMTGHPLEWQRRTNRMCRKKERSLEGRLSL
jgi:hypothetical protein